MNIADVVDAVRSRSPLVHCCTSVVSMPLIADGLLAAGASPCMTYTEQEGPSVAAAADALLVNLGTLNSDAARGIPPTVRAAVAARVPWVLDPPGVGLMPVRTALAAELLAQTPPAVVRCNGSEAMTLAGLSGGAKGPDSTVMPDAALEAARTVARTYGCVVAVSGPTDVITDGRRVARIHNDVPMLTRVTGTGCTLGGLVAACAAVADPWDAAIAASAWVTVAGQDALRGCDGPGSFKVRWLDALAGLFGADIQAKAKVS